MAKQKQPEYIKAYVRFSVKNPDEHRKILSETYDFNGQGTSEPARWIVGMLLTTLQFYGDTGILSIQQVNEELSKVRERLSGIMFLENKKEA